MQNSSIWVVVASEQSAAICRNTNGTSSLLRSFSEPSSKNTLTAEDARRIFAREIMMELCHGANIGAYEGVIIMASAEFIGELRKFLTPTVRRLLIAEITGTRVAALGFRCDTDVAQDTLKCGAA